jgi:hypothetical protein
MEWKSAHIWYKSVFHKDFHKHERLAEYLAVGDKLHGKNDAQRRYISDGIIFSAYTFDGEVLHVRAELVVYKENR